jgi:hypothetical protein
MPNQNYYLKELVYSLKTAAADYGYELSLHDGEYADAAEKETDAIVNALIRAIDELVKE